MAGRLRHRARMLGRLATVWGRPGPDFLIIGAQKCGTTSLYNYLLRHPAVIPAMKRSVKFFDHGPHWAKGVWWYRAHFPFASGRAAGRRPLSGECTPSYFIHPLGAQRVYEATADVRLIVLLRNPVDRAYSAYHHQRRRGREPLSFEEALEREAERVGNEYERLATERRFVANPYRHYSYTGWGHYADHLEPFVRLFGRERILVLVTEEFGAAPARAMADTHAFLGLPPAALDDFPRLNVGHYDAIDPRTRARLVAYFAPHNKRVADLLGRDPGWDR